MRVVLTAEAEADFNEIIDYIATRNLEAGLRFADLLETSYRELAANPKAYPLVRRHRHYGVRRRVVGSYLLFYRIDADAIKVMHIVHGARDYEQVLFPNECPWSTENASPCRLAFALQRAIPALTPDRNNGFPSARSRPPT